MCNGMNDRGKKKIYIALGILIVLLLILVSVILMTVLNLENEKKIDIKIKEKYAISTELAPVAGFSLMNGSFAFYDISSSIANNGIRGSYEIKDEVLILWAEDGENRYYFIKDGRDWLFDAKSSSHIDNISTNMSRTVKDGTRFVFQGSFEVE